MRPSASLAFLPGQYHHRLDVMPFSEAGLLGRHHHHGAQRSNTARANGMMSLVQAGPGVIAPVWQAL